MMIIKIDRNPNPVATRSFILDLRNFEVIDPLQKGQAECIKDYEGIETYKVLDPSPLWVPIPAIRVCGRWFEFPSFAADVGDYDLFDRSRFYYFTFAEYNKKEGWEISSKYPYILRVKTALDYEDSPSVEVFRNRIEIEVFPIGEISPICKAKFDPMDPTPLYLSPRDKALWKLLYWFSECFLRRLYEKGGIYNLDSSAHIYSCFSDLFQIFDVKGNDKNRLFILRKKLPVLIEFYKDFSLFEEEDFEFLRKYGIFAERYSKEIIMMRFKGEDIVLFIPTRKLISYIARKLDLELEEKVAEHDFLYHAHVYNFDPAIFRQEFLQELGRKVFYHAKDDISSYMGYRYKEEHISYKNALDAGICGEGIKEFACKYGLISDGSDLESIKVQVKWFIDNWERFSTGEKIGILKTFKHKFKRSRLNSITSADLKKIENAIETEGNEEDEKITEEKEERPEEMLEKILLNQEEEENSKCKKRKLLRR